MELVNKFDNALAGVAGDGGVDRAIANGANFLRPARSGTCRPASRRRPVHDNEQTHRSGVIREQQDAIFGAIASCSAVRAGRRSTRRRHCNNRGLTSLGEHTIKMADQHMLFDPDHLSVNARKAALDQTERMGTPASLQPLVVDARRLSAHLQPGGFVAPYAGDSTASSKWREHVSWADQRYYFGFGFGADINGFGSQGNPRGADVANPVTYPFQDFNGVTIDSSVAASAPTTSTSTASRQFGLYPDWVEDVAKVAGGAAIFGDMAAARRLTCRSGARGGIGAGLVPQRRPGQAGQHGRSLVARGMTTRP